MKIKNFIEQWRGRGYEKGETQKFWLQFLRDVLNISTPENFVQFELPVKLEHTNWIDVFFPDSKVIIEQKSLDKNLDAVNAYEQAQKYINGLPLSMHPKFIVTCNFREFLIYDMETLGEPQKILLEELPEKFHAFDFLIDTAKNKIRIELELSLQAGEIVGRLYDALHAQYLNPDDEKSLQSLNKLCVRLVFCLYAESSGIFGKHKIFRDYLSGSRNIRQDLILLFDVLNTPVNLRDPYLADELKIFPYVNGGLFSDEKIEIPNFTEEIKNLLLEEASSGFNWSGISPTIFGAVFESTLNPVTRRAGGMHYTSLENIHKVIDPLFLDDLNAEFKNIHGKKNLLKFQDKLANLKFFDPACGSGNFLTESFISLRRLENKILRELYGGQILMGAFENPVKVSINQFYGVEINDFACTVAKTALWISELQMIQETMEIIHRDLDFLPLKSYANITEGNALHLDWKNIAPAVDFVIGNPPFVGKSFQTKQQKSDMAKIFAGISGYGNLDYVACWYKKAAEFIQATQIRCAFVSTNSVTQGIAVPPLWKFLSGKNIIVNFAHQTFKWDSESTDKAAVHCVVIGFSLINTPVKKIFSGKEVIECENINAYLLPAQNVIVEPCNKSPYDVPPMIVGSCPTDGGYLILSVDERANLIKKFPESEKFIRQYMGGDEFINGKIRYCLWLKDATPAEIKNIPPIFERVKNVRDFRLASKKEQTRRRAETPTLFAEDRFIDAPAIFIPMVSSENRQYIPVGFIDSKVVVSNKALFIPNADKYLFGILNSSLHMAWVKTVAGRLKSDYSYGVQTVYNTFPFCQPTEKQRAKIETTARAILSARAEYPDSTLAELYNPVLMPKSLRAAHRANDAAVMAAYGFDRNLTEPEILAELIKKYLELTK